MTNTKTHPLVRQFANAMASAKPDNRPAVGSFVLVPFGARASQVAHVVGYTRQGLVKVRAWNNARGHWMPGLRSLEIGQLRGPATSQHLARLPRPPQS